MHHLALVLLSAVSFAKAERKCVNAAGQDVGTDVDAIIAAIGQTSSCNEAVELDWACAFGSSVDPKIATAAGRVCRRELPNGRLSPADRGFLTRMESRCNQRYGHEEGTMYLSFNAFCQLEALKWIVSVAAPADRP